MTFMRKTLQIARLFFTVIAVDEAVTPPEIKTVTSLVILPCQGKPSSCFLRRLEECGSLKLEDCLTNFVDQRSGNVVLPSFFSFVRQLQGV